MSPRKETTGSAGVLLDSSRTKFHKSIGDSPGCSKKINVATISAFMNSAAWPAERKQLIDSVIQNNGRDLSHLYLPLAALATCLAICKPLI